MNSGVLFQFRTFVNPRGPGRYIWPSPHICQTSVHISATLPPLPPPSLYSSPGNLPSSQTCINVFLSPSAFLVFCTSRSGISGFLQFQQLKPGNGTRFARSCCIDVPVSMLKLLCFRDRSMWSRKLTRAGLIESWKIRDVGWFWCWDWGWRNGSVGGLRGGSGREAVERERVWDIPNGAERGPLGE